MPHPRRENGHLPGGAAPCSVADRFLAITFARAVPATQAIPITWCRCHGISSRGLQLWCGCGALFSVGNGRQPSSLGPRPLLYSTHRVNRYAHKRPCDRSTRQCSFESCQLMARRSPRRFWLRSVLSELGYRITRVQTLCTVLLCGQASGVNKTFSLFFWRRSHST